MNTAELNDVLFGPPPGETLWHADDGWWINYHGDAVGPYSTKGEARETAQRLANFDRWKDKPGYITTDSKPKKPKG